MILIISRYQRSGDILKGILSMFDVPKCITTKYYDNIDKFSREGIWQLCYRDLTNNLIELNGLSELSELCFCSETIFPGEWQRKAETVLQCGKNNFLNAGILTGKGIKVAVIDRPINKNHVEFENRIEYIEVFPNITENRTDFHGMVCASFLAGRTCGIAPEAQLVYFAIPNKTSPIEDYYNYQLEALQKVVDYNKTNAEPIRIVSLSAPFTKNQRIKRDALEHELKQNRCTLIDATNSGYNFYGIDCIRHQEKRKFLLNQWQNDNYEANKDKKGFEDYFKSLCFVPSSRRTSAGNDSENEYIHWSKAVSESWTIPHIAGAYALCLQAIPYLTFDDFIQYSKHCPKQNGYTILDIQSIVKSSLHINISVN